MSKISAIILTKESEELIADCIDSVSFCDEIIVIDSNSTDRTPDLAKHIGAKVFKSTSVSFSEKRNIGLQKAKSKWILYIDDDERISDELKKSILEVVGKNKNEFSAYKINRKNFYFGNFEWPQIEEHVRLFDKKALKEWTGKLHETAQFIGEVSVLEGYLMHYTHRNLSEMVKKTADWSGIEAELRLKANHPRMSSWRFFRVMITAFYDSYFRQKGYKAGTAGVVESIYQSFSIFITYARLWELQNKNK
ncbi:MAG TPA: glycosyltransferase family 2 protein [Candidatus Limnocylindrales bacterium]|nr:glycosyltransferase family 2 protein [Candidatus Limnocylindrales bacterium]